MRFSIRHPFFLSRVIAMMHGYGMWGFGWLFQLLIFVAALFILWWVLRGSVSFGDESPQEILKRRLAKGEINEKEYRKLKKEIV